MNATGPTGRQPPPPPLALLAALGLWGWQAELLPWGIVMGVIIEGARWSPVRFELDRADFNRLWNFTTLLFIGVALYLFLAREGFSTVGSLVTTDSAGTRLEGLRRLSQTAVTFVRWLPLVLFPFAAVHAWSRTVELPWSTFSLYLRAREARRGRSADPGAAADRSGIHFGHLFLATTLFASCATVAHAMVYLPLFMAVAAYALWPFRNPRFSAPVWAALVVVILGTSFAAQRGLMAVRGLWQELENRWMQRAGSGDGDQLRGYTALGAVGRIKQSGAIVLRIRGSNESPPPLLREAVYNRFRLNAWSSTHRDFGTVDPLIEGVLWRLDPQHRGGESFQVARFTSGGSAALALPAAAHTIRDLPALLIETNYLSAARLQFGPPLAVYTVEHGVGGGFDGPPEADDTDLDHLAAPDREVVRDMAAAWGLLEGTPRQAVDLVRQHLARFDYSLWQPPRRGGTNPSALGVFLRETRAGHCEYFATATVLLLRAAGVPTRYVVGYSVSERRGSEWVARGRDAHAWCLAFLDGRWEELDTTPGSWLEREQTAGSWWLGIADLFADGWYYFTWWRQSGGTWRLYVFAASVGALGWLGWRQLRGSRWRRSAGRGSRAGPGRLPPGSDSELYTLVRRWEQVHGPRAAHETMKAWVARLGLRQGLSEPALDEAVELHYRLRFDPRGLNSAERDRLRTAVAALTPPR